MDHAVDFILQRFFYVYKNLITFHKVVTMLVTFQG